MTLVFANAVVRADCRGHTRRVSSVCLTGSRALSGSLDKTLRLWDVASGECLSVLSGHESDVNALAVSDDGKHAISGSGEIVTGEKLVRLWDLASGRVLRDFQGHTAEVSAV